MNKLLKASEEFVVGKHQIGWVDDDFKEEFSKVSFTMPAKLPEVTTLRKYTDGNELLEKYPNLCTLGDVLLYMKKKKDWAVFLVRGNDAVFVVHVCWYSDCRKWLVHAWDLDRGWSAGYRSVFHTDSPSEPLNSLEDRVKRLEEIIEKHKL